MKALPSLARPLLAHHPAPTSNQPPVRSPLASPDSSPRLPRTALSTPQAPVGPRRGLAYRQVPLTFCSVDEYVNECYVLASDLQSFPMALGAQAAGQFSALWTRPLAIGLDHVTLTSLCLEYHLFLGPGDCYPSLTPGFCGPFPAPPIAHLTTVYCSCVQRQSHTHYNISVSLPLHTLGDT